MPHSDCSVLHGVTPNQNQMFANQNISFFQGELHGLKYQMLSEDLLNIMVVYIYLSIAVKTKSLHWERQKSVKWFVLKPDRYM